MQKLTSEVYGAEFARRHFFTAAEYAGKVTCTVEANLLDGERRTGQQNLCVTQTLLLQIIMRTEADVPGKTANEMRDTEMVQIGKYFERDLFLKVLGDILDRRTNHLGNIRLGVRRGKTAQHGLDADRNAVLIVHLLVTVVENLLKIRENLMIPIKADAGQQPDISRAFAAGKVKPEELGRPGDVIPVGKAAVQGSVRTG
ncbi:hypothetical protein [Butyricicoccus sp. OF27-2pH9A]|uniref:hypothetical protein n=1 Tax=Butyricicoccus sp. OF27-2pH9A TaxID=3002517 RepID=UPI0022E38AFE|nr:hypothetical protein [Butyricicoccus sp. OF27-2pH9A]